uniref:Integrase catalytic domain-containing protein n=1 Tax=Globodera pallida TaxID=36090 RepID=A0A183BSK2_GLOPA
MSSTNSTATILKLKSLIARYGLPETVVSDNGTQFRSHQFATFTKSNGIDHIFSAPYAPQSNGQAERMVDTFKRAFAKIKVRGTLFCAARLCVRRANVRGANVCGAPLLRRANVRGANVRGAPQANA